MKGTTIVEGGVVPVALREGIWLLDRGRVRERLLRHQGLQATVLARDEGWSLSGSEL